MLDHILIQSLQEKQQEAFALKEVINTKHSNTQAYRISIGGVKETFRMLITEYNHIIASDNFIAQCKTEENITIEGKTQQYEIENFDSQVSKIYHNIAFCLYQSALNMPDVSIEEHNKHLEDAIFYLRKIKNPCVTSLILLAESLEFLNILDSQQQAAIEMQRAKLAIESASAMINATHCQLRNRISNFFERQNSKLIEVNRIIINTNSNSNNQELPNSNSSINEPILRSFNPPAQAQNHKNKKKQKKSEGTRIFHVRERTLADFMAPNNQKKNKKKF